jgi:two-component system LytT family response regulator
MAQSSQDTNQVKLLIRSHQKVVIISSNQIIALSATGTYTNIVLVSGKSLTMSKPLKYYEKQLQGANFYRCHKSHLVNLKYFTEFNIIKRKAIFSGIAIPVSRRNQSEFLHIIYEKFTT